MPSPFIRVHAALRNALTRGQVPGAVLVCGRADGLRHQVALGHAQRLPTRRRLTAGTLFDLASLTKVLATTWLAMKWHDTGALDLDAPMGSLLVGYYPDDKAGLTVRQLMCHAAGLPSGVRLRDLYAPDQHDPGRRRQVVERFLAAPLEAEPGSRTLYSDIGPVLVGDLLEQLGGDRLDRLAARELYAPLRLEHTFFVDLEIPASQRRPPSAFAATEDCPWRRRVVAGEVHDENAHLMSGIAGHAGLFSRATDLEGIARAYLHADPRLGVRPATLAALIAPQGTAPDRRRAFGWDTARADGPGGARLSSRAYGHTGFTGTSLWIDPEAGLYVVLLTNRVHPSRQDTGFLAFRPRLHDLVVDALLGAGALSPDAEPGAGQAPLR